jgi:hypothetical protein
MKENQNSYGMNLIIERCDSKAITDLQIMQNGPFSENIFADY